MNKKNKIFKLLFTLLITVQLMLTYLMIKYYKMGLDNIDLSINCLIYII